LGQSSWLFKQLEVRDGLSHNQINHIFKDSSGFMWFSTASGLNRYDGYKFKVFFHNPNDEYSLPDNLVSSVQEDVNGRLWIHTANGYTVFNPEKEKFEKSAMLLQEMGIANPVDLIFIDNDKNVWCYVTASGFYRYHAGSGRLMFFPQNGQPGNLSSGPITDFTESESDYLFVFQSGLVQYMDKSNLRVHHSDNYIQHQQHTNVQSFQAFVDSDNDLWIYSDMPLGTWYYNARQKEWKSVGSRKSNFPFFLSSDMIQDIEQDPAGLIWMATDHGGIDIIDKKANKLTNLQNQPYDERSIAHNSINCIYADQEDMIWIGTYKNGISYFSESMYKFGIDHLHYFNKIDHFKPDVNSIIKDQDENIWIGSNGSGLVKLHKKSGTTQLYSHDPSDNSSLTSNVIVSLCAAENGKLWIGTYLSGMDCFDGKKFVHYRHDPNDPNSLANDNVWSIAEDRYGMIWIGTLGGGLQRFNPENGQFTTFNNSTRQQLSSEFISSIFPGKNDRLILGTAIGLTIFDIKTEHADIIQSNRKGDQLFTNLNVNHAYEDSRGLIWVGTRNGLNIWDPKQDKITQLYKSDGLADNVISGIIEDNQHNMWVTTSNGVSNIMIQVHSVTGEYYFSFVNYREEDGLQSHEFNLRSIFKSPDGEILLGGTRGFNIFNPENIRYNTIQPKVLFTGLRLFNEEVEVGAAYQGNRILSAELNRVKEVTFKYRQNVFSVEFSSMNYVLPEKTTYAYMLEGFNTDWLITDHGVHSVTYTNLAPGNYTLRVKAANSDGFWSDDSTVLNIHIKPPFWLSPLAYVFYLFLVISILLYARYTIIRNEKQKFKVKQVELEAQRKHEIDDMKLRFFTNVSHELRTPLTLIISPLENMMKTVEDDPQKKQLTLIHKNAIRLLNMVNQLLDFRKSDVNEHALNLSYDDIIPFLRNSCNHFIEYAQKKNIRLTFFSSVDELSMVFDEDKMGKIMMNLLSNAIKFTEKNGAVDVMAKLLPKAGDNDSEQLEIRVMDNGIGIKDEEKKRIFERFYQGKTRNEDFPGSGIGLHIVKEFVSLCKGSVQVYDNVPKGSLFVLYFPVERLEYIVSQPAVTTEGEQIRNRDEEASFGEEEHVRQGNETLILLVDDNDDFRYFMRDTLKDNFSLIDASNGKEAWEKILAFSPDIIISDVMMPEMDGYELCAKVKNDLRTSHIPLILLTAHTAKEQELHGLETGADDYITKPFHFDILVLRINKMLELRSHRQKKFKNQVEIQPAEITITPLDEKLIKQAIKLVEDHIADSEFSVERLSKELGISRVHLYKKMISITGKSPIEFIRIIRLKRAAQLLRKSQLQISEIAYQVGFNNPKNFSKYFKEEFDVLPSQYQRNASKYPDHSADRDADATL
jgi:signal transduction histidine kinase/ligand-binding sensor domain-containing protein/DNA-binding response OmpR family regulator